MRHPVSLLSLTDRGWIQVVSFLASGVLIILFAVGLRRVLMTGVGATWGPIAIGAAGLGLVIAGVFPPDPSFGYPQGAPPGIERASAAAYVHVVGALLFFVE